MAYGADLLTNLKALLFDETPTTWTDALKVVYINEALHTIVLLRPDATATTAALSLTANTSKQTIPVTGVRLLEVIKNTSGLPIRQIGMDVLSETIPEWTAETTATAIQHYVFDPKNPTVFWVYPVPTTVLQVDIIYAAYPPTFSSSSTSLGIPEIFVAPVKDYVMYRCYGSEGDGADYTKATAFLNSFHAHLGKGAS